MKTPVTLKTYLALSVILVAATACSSIDSRIKEKQALYNSLTPAEQQTIQRGYITQGFTPDMVYMALDKPERVIPGATPGTETWVYHNFYSTDGSTNAPAAKVVTRQGASMSSTGGGAGGPSASMPGTIKGSGGGSSSASFTVEPDLNAENYQVESHIKVFVKFTNGKVTSIDIQRV